MRKLYTLLLLALSALLPMTIEAAPVTVQQARVKAVEFFQSGSMSRAVPTLELAWSDQNLSRSNEEATLYIFNRTDAPGFVVMAGDDAAAPVLGYSFEHSTGNLDEMPAHIRYWLDGMAEQVRALRASGAASQSAWQGALTAGSPIRELPTALWNQGEPYNRECPVLSNGQRAATGCVQTAAAIIIKYNRWPDSFNGTVTVPGYKTLGGIEIPARTLSSYDFDKLPDSYVSGQYTDEQAAEVARLMADLGTMDKAEYGTETGAYYSRLEWALGEYMRYSKQASIVTRASYSDEQWAALIKKEIDANRPLLYDGHGPQGGHAFVLDGYDSEDYFRFNWGWGGQMNGYFTVANLVVGGSDYITGQSMIIDLIPDKEGASSHNDNLMLGSATLNTGEHINGLQLNVASVAPNVPFEAEVVFFNIAVTAYNGKVAMAVTTKSGDVKNLVSTEKPVVLNGGTDTAQGLSYSGNYDAFDCVVTNTLTPGDRLRVVFWDNAKKKWVAMGSYVENAPYEIILMPDEVTAETVAEGTSFAYDRTTKKLTIATYNGVTVKLVGGSLSKEVKSDGQPVIFDLASAAKGTYTLSLILESGESSSCKVIL
ncbi:MAG: C10 family peptidase [Alistipes sp.]|nr:C10 family peptidase [Alistipes sp.]